MLPLFAAADLPAPDSYPAIGWLLVSVGAIAMGAYYILACWEKITGKHQKREIQQPLVVTPHAELATRTALDQVEREAHGRIKRERDEINHEIRRVENSAEKRTDKLEVKIEENTTLTAKMSGQVEQMNQNIHTLTTSVTNFMRDQARASK